MGSVGDLQYQLKAAIDCRAIPQDEGVELAKRAEEVAKMTQGLMRGRHRQLDRPARAPLIAYHPITHLVEMITHLAFYAGWPSANTAVQIARQVFPERPR